MQTLLHEPSWPRFTLSLSIGGICLLILLVQNLMGQREDRIRRAASSDFIAEMLRQEKPDNAMIPRRVESRSRHSMRVFVRFAFRWFLIALICVTGIEAILAYKTVTNFDDGQVRLRQGHYPEAILAYRMALAADNRSAAVHYYLGIALMAQGHTEEALLSLQDAITYNPKMEAARIDYGNALFQERRYADALESYRAARHIAPKDRIARTDIAIALQAMGRMEEALPLYRRVVETAPNDALARLNLANALAQMHRYPEAEVEYRRLLKQRPGDAAVRLAFGLLCREQKRAEEALRQILMATELDPADANAQFQYGTTLTEHAYFSTAETALRRSIFLDKNYPPAYFALGEALRGDNKSQEAVSAYQSYLKRAQGVPAYSRDVAKATEALRQMQGAH
jgi:tetratricopeptide (TPR) repeat protein